MKYLDKNNNVIKIGDTIRVNQSGFKSIPKIIYDSLIKRKNIKDKYEFCENSNLYYEIDINDKRITWERDYTKEVIEINGYLGFGFEGSFLTLSDYNSNDLEIIK